jgi:hypothetical protein
MINCAMQRHKNCPYIIWLVVVVSHSYYLLHSRLTNSLYVASFKVIRFYINIISSFTYYMLLSEKRKQKNHLEIPDIVGRLNVLLTVHHSIVS